MRLSTLARKINKTPTQLIAFLEENEIEIANGLHSKMDSETLDLVYTHFMPEQEIEEVEIAEGIEEIDEVEIGEVEIEELDEVIEEENEEKIEEEIDLYARHGICGGHRRRPVDRIQHDCWWWSRNHAGQQKDVPGLRSTAGVRYAGGSRCRGRGRGQGATRQRQP